MAVVKMTMNLQIGNVGLPLLAGSNTNNGVMSYI